MSQERVQVSLLLTEKPATAVMTPSSDQAATAIDHAPCPLGRDGRHTLTTDQLDAVLMQSQSAFARHTLLNPAEDCWDAI
jgi:hypothetical protein